jgi:hypothetical protein
LRPGQAVAIRAIEAAPRWEDPLSTIQDTRLALAYGSVVITCWTRRENGAIPVVSSHRPVTRPRWTSQAARQARAPPRWYSCSMRIARALPGGRVGWQRHRAWIEVFSSAQIT